MIEVEGFGSAGLAAAIQRAGKGDCVRLGEGVYEISETMRCKSGLGIVGAGAEKTRLVYRGKKAAAMVSMAGCEDVELAELTIDGQDNPLVEQGIVAGDSRRLRIHHLVVKNLAKGSGWGPHGILFSGQNPSMERGVTDSTISDCRFEKIGPGAEYGGAIRMAWGSVRNVVERNVIKDTGRGGIFGDHSAELIIRNNQVSGSGGEGLGIEIWGGCPRSLIEDNTVDHWISVDGGNLSAVRRNTIGTDDGTLKGYGIEIIARDMVVTDNVVKKGAMIGLSVSNVLVKNNVYWGYNRISDCVQWAAQLQGESGGIARQYFYRCMFENTVRGDERAMYRQDSGHGFRTNGACRSLVLEECAIRNNGGIGVQLGGKDVDGIRLVRCTISGNGGEAVRPPGAYTALELADCTVEGNGSNERPAKKGFEGAGPKADFGMPERARVGEAVRFEDRSAAGKIVERLWDLGEGIPEFTGEVTHTYQRAGKYRVTLVVWDEAGRGGRAEKMIEVRAE